MNTAINFLKKLFTNETYHFYWFTFLWITTLFTQIPFLRTGYLLHPICQKFNFLSIWFTNNKSLLLSILSLLLLFETLTLIFTFISYKTSYYEFELQILYTFLLNISSDSLLLFQLFKNIGITNFGINEIFLFYNDNFSITSILCILSLAVSLTLIFLKIIGYFYRAKH